MIVPIVPSPAPSRYRRYRRLDPPTMTALPAQTGTLPVSSLPSLHLKQLSFPPPPVQPSPRELFVYPSDYYDVQRARTRKLAVVPRKVR